MELERVLDADLCSGCGLCAAVLGTERARMALNAAGYLRPKIAGEITKDEGALIERVCRGRLDFKSDDAQFVPVWGPVLGTYTGHASDEGLRYKASSGGVISAIAQHILDSGEADYAVHVGADVTVPWLNDVKESRGQTEIADHAGSRYAPSAPLENIIEQLQRPGRAVIIAKPCDIAALRMYSYENPLVEEKIAYMLTFMCGGVPSAQGVEEVLRRMNASPEEVVSFKFRGDGWPGKACATLKNGERRTLSYMETWGTTLSNYVQKRCKVCPDGVGLFADLVCGDAWYGDERGYPKFEENEGRSLIIARTPKGRRLLNEAQRSKYIRLENCSLEEIATMQPSQVRRTQLTLSRVMAMALVGKAVPRYRGLRIIRAALQGGALSNLKSFLGSPASSLQW